MAYQKRLKKEYEELSLRAPIGIKLDQETAEDNIDMWVSIVTLCLMSLFRLEVYYLIVSSYSPYWY